jgi:DNA-binding MurR/RpiR family transcriptional regulator
MFTSKLQESGRAVVRSSHKRREQRRAASKDGVSGAKAWMTPLETRFAAAEHALNSSRKRLLREILDNPDDHYFLSSRALARRYDVDAATIVRMIQVLGYERYAHFAADLRAHFVTRISPYTLMKSAASEHRPVPDHVAQSLEMAARNLEAFRSSLDTEQIIAVARRIDRARRVMVVGVDFAYSLAYPLAYGLVSLGYDAEAPSGSTGGLHQKVNLLGSKDLLIAISFGRCLRDTVDSVVRARARGAFTFGITDSDRTPIARFCESVCLASIATHSFHGSYVAPLAAIDALLVSCAHLQPQRSLAALRHKEQELRSGSRWYAPPDESGKNHRRRKGGRS